MIAALEAVNPMLRFALEVALLNGLAVSCWRTIPADAPRADVPAPVQVAQFAAPVTASTALRRPELATTFGVAAFLDATRMWAWGR